MENKKSRSYILLWILVIILTIAFISSYLIFGIGLGRWECIEYSEKQYTETCIEDDKSTTYKIDKLDDTNYGCENKSFCTGELKIETTGGECIKKAWIKK